MTTVGITAFGGYIPRMRLKRESIVKANGWINEGLYSYGKSERAMCNVDEDSVTMAVEAARDCLNRMDLPAIEALYFASTTMPFSLRQNSSIIAEALNLPERLVTIDISSSLRAGTSGLIAAFKSVQKGGAALFTASDSRRTKTANVEELVFGDGASALTVGPNKVLAELIGTLSINKDFVDQYRLDGADYAVNHEERWIRDEGYFKLIPRAVEELLGKTGVSADKINHFIMPCIIRRVRATLADKMGIPPRAVRDDLFAGCGDTGAAHPVLMLAHSLEEAVPGQKILVLGFGQGVDALLFETTDMIQDFSPRKGVAAYLANKKTETNYQKFLSFKDMVDVDWGMRAESTVKYRPSAAWRDHKHFNAMIGGRCKQCGVIQFPSARICVNPECRSKDAMEDYRLSDGTAKIVSFTADRLAYSPNPPLLFGMVQFEEGAKLMMNFTDCDFESLKVGLTMRMVFRIMNSDKSKQLRTYFWKATPKCIGGEEG